MGEVERRAGWSLSPVGSKRMSRGERELREQVALEDLREQATILLGMRAARNLCEFDEDRALVAGDDPEKNAIYEHCMRNTQNILFAQQRAFALRSLL